MNIFKLVPLLCAIALLSACAHPSTTPVVQPLTATDTVRTLTAGVSLSMHAQGGGLSARGYLIFRQPDLFRLIITSPFGATVAELSGSGDRLSIVVPGKRVVYRGSIGELHPQNPLRNWGRMRWVMAPLTEPPGRPGTVDRLTPEGQSETVVYDDNGLVERKSSAGGDEVQYLAYRLYDGAAVPAAIMIGNGYGDTVKLVLEDPEVNTVREDSVMHPDITGYDVHPLSDFKGF
jgi:outer membrane biogenesis lipoprotein LolB